MSIWHGLHFTDCRYGTRTFDSLGSSRDGNFYLTYGYSTGSDPNGSGFTQFDKE